MDNIKNDVYYVKKMLKDIGFIIEKTEGIDVDKLKENEVLCDSVLFRLIQISENSVKLSAVFRETHDDIPWQAIKGMRNKIVHDYGDVNFDIIYQTISDDIPEIFEKLKSIL